MDRRVALVSAAVVFLSSAVAAQKSEPDIQALTEQYEQAFDKGDAKALAALHSTDAVRLGADGELVAGRAAIEKHMASAFGGPAKGAKLTLRPGRVQNVTSDVRIVEGTYEVSGGSMGPLRGRYVNTIVRQDGQWRLASVVTVPQSDSTRKPASSGAKPISPPGEK